MSTNLFSIILVVISSIIGAFGGFFFKRATRNLKIDFKNLIKNINLILGLLLFVLGATSYIIALKGGELNILYPISSLTYVWSTLIAKRYLDEKINFFKIIGIVLIVLGSLLIVG